MRLVWLLGLWGCGGDKDGTADTSGTSGEPVVIDCDLPQYDLEGMDCQQLAYSFEQLTNFASDCNTDADCHPVRPACEQWDAVECYYPVNFCLTTEIVSTYNAQGASCSDIGGVTFQGCVCGDEPAVVCLDHKCELK